VLPTLLKKKVCLMVCVQMVRASGKYNLKVNAFGSD